MNVTILFGDRERKSPVDVIVRRARDVVDAALARIGGHPAGSGIGHAPVWHSVAMRIDCAGDHHVQRLLAAIHEHCQQSRVKVMGVRRG